MTDGTTRFAGMLPPRLLGLVDHGFHDDYFALTLRTERGDVLTRLYAVANAQAAVLTVGGAGGGFDSPAKKLYDKLGRALARHDIATLRVRFRNPTLLNESVHDALAGAMLLQRLDIPRLALVGHSFGGSVVIQAAAVMPEVRTIVTLATQSYGTEAVSTLAPRSVLLIHGKDDQVLPPTCSVQTYQQAKQPKALHLIPGAGHDLNEAAGQVYDLVFDWLRRQLEATALDAAS